MAGAGLKRNLWALARRAQVGRDLWVARRLRDPSGYLSTSGWLRSLQPDAAEGAPLPLLPYSLVAFLEPRLRPDMCVFEYGAGRSTLWWSARVGRVVACEHDPDWRARIEREAGPNVRLVFHPLQYGGEYSREITRHAGAFQIVVVDGRDRVNCLRNSPVALTPDGVVLCDDTERPAYAAGCDSLVASGFRRLDFGGLRPGCLEPSSASVFYRDGNCLGL